MSKIEDVLINTEEGIKIELFYKKSKGSAFNVTTDLSTLKEDKRKDYSKITFIMRPMVWGLYNRLQREAIVEGGTPNERIDWSLYKERKIFASIMGWDVTDKNDVPVPVTPEMIMKLHPVMVETLLNTYDSYSFLGENDSKKS
jgi:hypothetical protein